MLDFSLGFFPLAFFPVMAATPTLLYFIKLGGNSPGVGRVAITPVSKHYHPQSSKPIILLIIDYPNLFTKYRPDPVKMNSIPTKRAEVKCLN